MKKSLPRNSVWQQAEARGGPEWTPATRTPPARVLGGEGTLYPSPFMCGVIGRRPGLRGCRSFVRGFTVPDCSSGFPEHCRRRPDSAFDASSGGGDSKGCAAGKVRSGRGHELPGGFGPRARAAQIPSSLGRAPPITLRAETEARSNQAGRENEL